MQLFYATVGHHPAGVAVAIKVWLEQVAPEDEQRRVLLHQPPRRERQKSRLQLSAEAIEEWCKCNAVDCEFDHTGDAPGQVSRLLQWRNVHEAAGLTWSVATGALGLTAELVTAARRAHALKEADSFLYVMGPQSVLMNAISGAREDILVTPDLGWDGFVKLTGLVANLGLVVPDQDRGKLVGSEWIWDHVTSSDTTKEHRFCVRFGSGNGLLFEAAREKFGQLMLLTRVKRDAVSDGFTIFGGHYEKRRISDPVRRLASLGELINSGQVTGGQSPGVLNHIAVATLAAATGGEGPGLTEPEASVFRAANIRVFPVVDWAGVDTTDSPGDRGNDGPAGARNQEAPYLCSALDGTDTERFERLPTDGVPDQREVECEQAPGSRSHLVMCVGTDVANVLTTIATLEPEDLWLCYDDANETSRTIAKRLRDVHALRTACGVQRVHMLKTDLVGSHISTSDLPHRWPHLQGERRVALTTGTVAQLFPLMSLPGTHWRLAPRDQFAHCVSDPTVKKRPKKSVSASMLAEAYGVVVIKPNEAKRGDPTGFARGGSEMVPTFECALDSFKKLLDAALADRTANTLRNGGRKLKAFLRSTAPYLTTDGEADWARWFEVFATWRIASAWGAEDAVSAVKWKRRVGQNPEMQVDGIVHRHGQFLVIEAKHQVATQREQHPRPADKKLDPIVGATIAQGKAKALGRTVLPVLVFEDWSGVEDTYWADKAHQEAAMKRPFPALLLRLRDLLVKDAVLASKIEWGFTQRAEAEAVE